MAGEDWGIENNDRVVFIGISVDWPFPGKVAAAEHETTKIGERKSKLSNQNKYLQILTDLKNLNIAMEREKRLLKIADEKDQTGRRYSS